jgi:hypothetical protein
MGTWTTEILVALRLYYPDLRPYGLELELSKDESSVHALSVFRRTAEQSIYMQAWIPGSQPFDAFRGHAKATTVLHGGTLQLSWDHDTPCGRQKGPHGTHVTTRSG